MTPTEAGAIAVAYALVVGIFVYRELHWRDLGRIFRETGVNVGTVMIILAAGSFFGWALSSMGVGPALTRFFLSISHEPWAMYLMIGLLTPPVGFLLYLTSAITEARFERVVAERWPLIAILVGVLFVSTYWPQMPLHVPNLVMRK